MKKYESITISLEDSDKGPGGSSLKLTLSEDPKTTKGNAEFNGGYMCKFSINVEGFARGYLEYVVNTLDKRGFFQDNNTYGSAYPNAFDYHPHKTLEVKVTGHDGTQIQKQVNGDTNPYQDLAYNMLIEPFRTELSRTPIEDLCRKELPHYDKFHKDIRQN